MTGSSFDENTDYGYSNCMKNVPLALLSIPFCSLALAACSFDYGAGTAGENAVPEMVLTDVSASRYENARISVVLDAGKLELYTSDNVWAGENVSFTQYAQDGSGTVDAEGSAGLLLVDDTNEVYSLGENVSFHLLSDDFLFRANDLRWTKKKNLLSSSDEGEVAIEESDGSVIKGSGFFADTLSRTYAFSKPVSGVLVNDASGTVEK